MHLMGVGLTICLESYPKFRQIMVTCKEALILIPQMAELL